ncbi:LysR family transcriptional regulator [Motiliproteus sp. MSK22-1]|uniref:LysR family transcriptional regulator n=1 Tax=Motiliproteus sp. MSK22-1 TaxID=1897630 RepID=UPI0009784407|nr:LysR family transcriptional regulator [Motiliproteus sp. MSK22-1]OMH38709.1 LysR family transcriptional regulator [Motiliproteus sp. MSK22-1]
MDIQALRSFVIVAETSSFSLAADQLFITQPAISKRISNLEDQVDCRLFDRIGRKVSLTEAGKALLPKARNILLEIDDTQRLLHNMSGQVGGKLSLAASHHVSLHRLPPILKRYSMQHPQATLDLKFTESEVAYDQILHGSRELAIITLSPLPHPQIESREVWIDQMRYVVTKEHPLAQQSHVQFKDLYRYNAILPEKSTFTRQIAEQHFDAEELELNVIMSTNYLDTIRMMVSVGLGWSLLPDTMIDDTLKVLPVSDQEIQRPLGFIYHRDRTLSNAAKAFIELLSTKNRNGR